MTEDNALYSLSLCLCLFLSLSLLVMVLCDYNDDDVWLLSTQWIVVWQNNYPSLLTASTHIYSTYYSPSLPPPCPPTCQNYLKKKKAKRETFAHINTHKLFTLQMNVTLYVGIFFNWPVCVRLLLCIARVCVYRCVFI